MSFSWLVTVCRRLMEMASLGLAGGGGGGSRGGVDTGEASSLVRVLGGSEVTGASRVER